MLGLSSIAPALPNGPDSGHEAVQQHLNDSVCAWEVRPMDLQVQQLEDGIDRVSLSGRLDSAGVEAIDGRLSSLTASPAPRILVDLSQVSFLASIGIRTLLTTARVLKQRGGKMALLKPQALVEEVLKVTGIESIIPIFHDIEAASAALKVKA
jgi:anti-anti-sigma factor